MVAHFQQLQNPVFDALFCDEERFDEDLCDGFGLKEQEIENFNEIQQKPFLFLFEHDLFWEDEEILTLLSKEKKQTLSSYECVKSDGSLITMRNEAIKWMLKVIARYCFAAMTAVLAVNYYDRFITSACFQREKPWMSQLAAVACLSIAAKVEETQVPVLLEFQVEEESKYVFEARTIQRMELLVLSTLNWRMNPVTPISFFDHIVRRFKLITNLHCDFLRRCESVVLSIITDCRVVDYLPSVIAAATMKHVIGEIEPFEAVEYQNQLISALQTSREKIDDCHNLILEVMGNHGRNLSRKRIYEPVPSSPSGVIDAYFNSDSSNESWSVASSMVLPEPQLKRSRVQDQHMRLAPLSTVFVGLAKDPH